MSWFKSKEPEAPKPPKPSRFSRLQVDGYFSMGLSYYRVLEKFPNNQAVRAVEWSSENQKEDSFLVKVTEGEGKEWYQKVSPLEMCPSELTDRCIYWKDHHMQHSDGQNSWVEA